VSPAGTRTTARAVSAHANLGAAPAVRVGGTRLPLLGTARVYVCGITPYETTHVGHAATFVWADVAARVLRLAGATVEVCRNVTDVDDVLDAAARRAGAAYDEFAAIQQFQFDRDMAALGVRAPEHEPRAHRYVAQVIRLASGLLDVGAAYTRGGNVYFRGHGVTSRVGLDRAEALRLSGEYGGRPDDPAKDDPLDVAVWQASEAGHPAWESPWGAGRPGWHAECAAMAMSVFGPAVDIHAGGLDLRFPHHAYHAAMAEAFTGVRPYARAWFHSAVVTIDGAKMAKSAGNLVLVGDLLAKHAAGAVRLMILDRPWGQNWDYRPALLEAAAARLDTLYQAAAQNAPNDPAAVDALRRLFADDLNVPAALDLAIEAGGAAARTLVSVLGLS
jgi:cysteinyl-tRNA synthetase